MLHRAASNAYSWWWASHIRTKQSKWLEQNLQDMEEKVQSMLKLIEEDGDSFAKRAEMYYKRRPELINFVHESYRAYRALVERYDHISTELQNANNTIASVFPEQVQFTMDEDDEYGSPSPRTQKKFPESPRPNIPKVPKLPTRDLKGLLKSATKKMQNQKASKGAISSSTAVAKSGLSKPEAVEEIDKLQKGILALQTEKEFVKSSFENRLAEYWEIEKQIKEMHENICYLQDEFNASRVIEDDEARTLMAAAALKSCQNTLVHLQDKQKQSVLEARVEHQRIDDARRKLKSLKNELLPGQVEQAKPFDKDEPVDARNFFKNSNQDEGIAVQERQHLESLREKIKEHFEVGSNTSLTVAEMAEKIDELVNKVINLETAVLSQTAVIKRLQTETGELHAQISSLESDKASLINGTNDLSTRLKEMDEKLVGIEYLNQNVEDQNNNLETHFTEARCNLDKLSEKLNSVKPDEELEATDLNTDDGSLYEAKSTGDSKKQENTMTPVDNLGKLNPAKSDEKLGYSSSSQKEAKKEQKGVKNQRKSSHLQATDDPDSLSRISEEMKPQDRVDNQDSSQMKDDLNEDRRELGAGHEEEPNWQQLFLNGLEDREKILLQEYTTTLRNYKEVKKNLGEVEKKYQDSLIETTVEVKELRSANASKDEEIQSLRQKLRSLQITLAENKDLKELEDLCPHPTSDLLDGKSPDILPSGEEADNQEDIKVTLIDQPNATSAIEEKFRMKIDEVLEQNLDFWLKFSSSFHQIQKFKTGAQDLQAEISKLEERSKQRQDGSSTTIDPSLKSDARPIYKHLREIETEVRVWLEQSALLKDELQRRLSSLCDIQEEISRALKAGAEDEAAKLTSYQAAKFQGEVLNMKQENNKVAKELQAALDHATVLELDIQKTLAKLDKEFELSESKNHQSPQLTHSVSKSRVPLQSFIFGVKQKKQRPSIFSSMHPAWHRKYKDLRGGQSM